MFKSLKSRLKRYPKVVKAYKAAAWKRHLVYEWRDTYIFKSKKEVLTPHGFKLTAGNYLANRMMQDGTFEPEETALLRSCMEESQVFVDVGANIGLYTCLARSVGRYAIAIEPQPRNLECLYANLTANGWLDTEVYPLGVSDQPGLVHLYGATGPSASLISGWAGYSKRFSQTISVVTLDTLIGDRFAKQKLLIKIDVEGAEYNVLRGAERTISMSPHPTWMIEVCLNEYHPSGMNPNYLATFDLFWKHGYEVHTADLQRRLIQRAEVESWIKKGRCDSGVINYLFAPKAELKETAAA